MADPDEKKWTAEELEAAIERGPHISAMDPDAMKQLNAEVAEKVKRGQVRVVNWDDIKSNPPPELKVSPIAMIPQKSIPLPDSTAEAPVG